MRNYEMLGGKIWRKIITGTLRAKVKHPISNNQGKITGQAQEKKMRPRARSI